ncbi:hypothetical protein UPYG_G00110510 [Umbra pygmaea]|uniref:Uncharacterized protein n=1 Tax=Umbra pygmaea TaxID=75934 RepID=A0ABD0XID7_UMBPY
MLYFKQQKWHKTRRGYVYTGEFCPRSILDILIKAHSRTEETLRNGNSTDMSDSETGTPTEAPVPEACVTIKKDLDKCVKEGGDCKDLMEAFAACVKSAAEAS